MATFGGTISESNGPTPILSAHIDANKLQIRHGDWIYTAESTDGFFYQGTYGRNKPDPSRIARFWSYSGADGSKVLCCEWQNLAEPTARNECTFWLYPLSEDCKTFQSQPAELTRAADALANSVARLALDSLGLSVILAHDRRTGRRLETTGWDSPGLYVLFYWDGSIARIGQTTTSLARRLHDYEPNASGWFAFRWIALIPIDREHACYITPLEDTMLLLIKPPENVKGC
jgi:hypothetical protein